MNTVTLASAWMDSPGTIALGALTGLVFGFLLQRGSVTRFGTIVDQLLLRDFTVLKVMLTAIVVGGVGIYAMRAMGMDVPLHIKGTQVLAVALGGGIFGVGMAVLGYCPGTAIAAIGDGSRHAWFGVLGMFVGGLAYTHAYPFLKDAVLTKGDLGKVTVASEMGVEPLVVLVPMALVVGVVFVVIERCKKSSAA